MNLVSPQIEEIATIDLRLEPIPWPFAIERASEIDAHWAELVSRNPHLFNGRVLLMRRLGVVGRATGRKLEGACFVAEYKAFLAWRDFGFADRTISNAFAMAALRSADGAFLLGEMGPSTANAGKIYFPSGTPDPSDLVGDAVNLEGNVLRELQEETGIAPDEVTLDPGWTVVFQGPHVACMKSVRCALSAAELVARGAAFIAQESRPELACLKPVFGFQDFDEKRMPGFILTYLRHMLTTNDR
jgi:8-oxo-dGTP pyrophosphatase MutT (NUDIX family)